MRKLLFIVATICLGHLANAQDTLFQRRGPVLIVKVLEVGTDEIKYKKLDNPDGPVYVVEKSSLKSISYANGQTEQMFTSFKDPQQYAGQLTKGIKIDFLAPLIGYTAVSFEKSMSPLKSYELSLGIIGAGKNEQLGYSYINGTGEYYRRNAFGGFLQAGYKFNKLPNFFSKGSRMTHVMQGTYAKPIAILGAYGDHALSYKSGQPEVEKRSIFFGAVLIDFGHQWVFGDKFLLDIYYGLGYAFDNFKSPDNTGYYYDYVDFVNNHFVVQKAGYGANLGVNGGIKVGLLIK